MKPILVHIVALFLTCGLLAQAPDITELRSQLSENVSTQEHIDILMQIGKQYRSSLPDSAIYFFEKARSLAEEVNDQLNIAKSMYFHSTVYAYQNDFDARDSLVDRGLAYSRKNEIPVGEGMFLDAVATRLEKQGKLMEAIDTLRRGLFLFNTAGHDHYASVAITNLSVLFNKAGLKDSALIYTQKSIDYKVDTDREKEAFSDYGNMGIMYLELDEFNLALDYHRKAFSLIDSSTQFKEAAWALANIGQVYRKMGQLDSAYHYAQIALRRAQISGRPFQIMNSSQLLGTIYEDRNQLDSAKFNFQVAYRSAKEMQNKIHQTTMRCHLARVDIGMGEGEKALKHLRWAHHEAIKNKNLPNISWSTELLSEAFSLTQRFDSAYFYSKLHKTYYDSVRGTEQSKHLAALERKYNSARQGRQLAEQDLTISRQESQLKLYGLLGLSALFLFLIVFLIYRYRQNLKEQAAQIEIQIEKNRSRQLEELDQMKSNFFANISHEIRTPLTLIMSPILNLKEQYKNRTQSDYIPIRTHHLDLIQRNTQRLQHLVDQILDLSKLDGGYMQLQMQKGDLTQMIKMLVFSFESLAERKNIHYDVDIQSCEHPSCFDEDKLEKMVINLLSNAFKFTPRGGYIKVTTSFTETKCTFEVADSGPGLTKDAQERIFNRFFQVAEGNGTGIGLSLVQELVDLYGGELGVDSQEGKGSTFKLSFPYRIESFKRAQGVNWVDQPSSENRKPGISPPPYSEIEGMPDKSSLSKSLPNLLVVEDNDELRAFIAETLSIHFQVSTAKNGQEGLESAIEKIPEIIVSDVMMPELDGVSMCTQLKQNEKTSHIPVILLTARAEDETKYESYERGADHYLTKPFSAQELKVIANNLVQQRRHLREKFGHGAQEEEIKSDLPAIDRKFLEKVLSIIDENISNDAFSVEDLAHSVAFSRSQLHRKLKAIADSTPSEMIRHRRLNLAYERIRDGEGTISEIAYSVGYGNLSYFTKSFKEKFGHLPSEF